MNIIMRNVLPLPMKQSVQQSDIWLTECEFASGKAYHVVAPSGTGKTSLLHILFGIRSDYEGEVLFDTISVASFTASDWDEKRTNTISMVFQGLRLFPELDIMENILLKNKRTHHCTITHIHEMLDAVGMMPHIHKKAGILSYGQQQRVAIVRALCQPFQVLLLDEPFSHLDNSNIQTAFECINYEVTKQHATSIITSLQESKIQTDMHVYYL